MKYTSPKTEYVDMNAGERFTCTLDKELLEKLNQLAERDHLSPQELFRTWIVWGKTAAQKPE